MRILYGLDRLPTTLVSDDPRLPAVEVGPSPLRLNSVALPPAAWTGNETDHTTCMAEMRAWLLGTCGDYNEGLRRGVTRYLDAIVGHVEQHRHELANSLAQFHGLYKVEDLCWSALRPLPRVWWRQADVWSRADLAFWDGAAVIVVPPQEFGDGVLPVTLQHFWTGETLPVSPFRRTFPAGLHGVSLRPDG